MSFHDCEKCWSNPCECGHDFKHWDEERLKKLIISLTKILVEKEIKHEREARKSST